MSIIKILYINIKGQSKFTLEKQLQLADLIRHYDSDIIHLQESDVDENVFEHCHFIKNNFMLISNNSPTGYGTATLVKNSLTVTNIKLDTEGRVIIFDIEDNTFCNVYLHAGTDSASKNARENCFSNILPNLLINRKRNGCVGGDWNSIICMKDATNHPNSKMSSGLKRLVKLMEWKDSHQVLHPSSTDFSHYYTIGQIEGATRLDREYTWGDVAVIKSEYVPVAFSDHLGLTTEVKLSGHVSTDACIPKRVMNMKISNEVACDKVFKDRVAEAFPLWEEILKNGLDILTWWELVIKPGVKEIAVERTKEINRDKKGELNMYLVKQAYLVKRLRTINLNAKDLTDLKTTQLKICQWYSDQGKKVKDQSRSKEFQLSEQTSIYHHELHKKHIKKAHILSLETDQGRLEGHEQCAAYLEAQVQELLGKPACLDSYAQEQLLSLVDIVVTEEDNVMLEAVQTKDEVLKTLNASNLHASAGSDGITGLVYKECWDTLGNSLCKVTQAMFSGSPPTVSMRTAMMNFCPKPKKLNSLKPSDKRRISVLNCDFKLYKGILARRVRKIDGHILSPHQYVAGENRTIHHAIVKARDAITAATRLNLRCGIGDQDYIAAFDFLVLSWVWMVLERKGVSQITIGRLKNLYANGITIPVINSSPRKAIYDIRGALRQGGVGSMEWFAIGIDPLLIFLDRNLIGIPVFSLPVLGPSAFGEQSPLPPLQEVFKLVAYCDDVKPAISNLNEFLIADKGASLFEHAAGTRLHRDPQSNKCKFLPLGRWRHELTQDMIPTPYMRITDTLDMIGVQLCALWSVTRRKNGEMVRQKVQKICGSWRAGKFLPLTQRPFSINTFALSKIWFRVSSVNLRESDFKSIDSSIKKWLYSDLFFKPEVMVLFRKVKQGGLALTSCRHKSLAFLIKTFLDLAANPMYVKSLYLNAIYRVYVLKENLSAPPPPPYYSTSFFETIIGASNAGNCIEKMTVKQWYNFLIETHVTNDHEQSLLPCRAERMNPDANWNIVWSNVRMPVIPNASKSFAWKLVHDLLPTENRLFAASSVSSNKCKASCPGDPIADLEHCFFDCQLTNELGMWLLNIFKRVIPHSNPRVILNLEFENAELLFLTIEVLYFSWSRRTIGKKASLVEFTSSIDADLMILSESKYRNLGEKVKTLMSQ